MYEGGVKDIVFEEANGRFYYMNRGLEQGYTLEGFPEKVLNKNGILRLANTPIESALYPIARIAGKDPILCIEFN